MACNETADMQEFKDHVFKRLDSQESDSKEMKDAVNKMANSVQELVVTIARKEERENAHNKEHVQLENRIVKCENMEKKCNELDKRLQAAEMRVADNHKFIEKYKVPLVVVSIIVLAVVAGYGRHILTLMP